MYLSAISLALAKDDSFTGTLGFLAFALPCFAFAWDGLVRRRVLLHAFPIGGGSITLKGIGALALALVSAALGLFFLLFAFGFYRLALTRCDGSVTCVLTSAQWPAWMLFGLFAVWFFFVWVRMGDARKRVLVYGVWYHQEKVARLIARHLRDEGKPTVSMERLYELQEQVVRLLHTQRWLSHGKTWLDGRNTIVREASLEAIIAEILSEQEFATISSSEREAIRFLVAYFIQQAEHAKHMSPIVRWWIGSAQIGKMQTYGARAT